MNDNKFLSPVEIRKVKDFMSKYNDFNEKILKIENRLEEIEKEKGFLFNDIKSLDGEINNLRKEEEKFRNTLLTKYGKFDLNLETFEIKQS